MGLGRVMALKDAAQDIIDELRKITDLRRVPDEPPETNSQFPFAVVYPIRGVYAGGPPGLMKGLHGIVIELHVARKDLPRDYDTVMDIIDQIPEQMLSAMKNARFENIDTFENIEYEFGALSWGGVDTLGVTYTMMNTKVQTTYD